MRSGKDVVELAVSHGPPEFFGGIADIPTVKCSNLFGFKQQCFGTPIDQFQLVPQRIGSGEFRIHIRKLTGEFFARAAQCIEELG